MLSLQELSRAQQGTFQRASWLYSYVNAPLTEMHILCTVLLGHSMAALHAPIYQVYLKPYILEPRFTNFYSVPACDSQPNVRAQHNKILNTHYLRHTRYSRRAPSVGRVDVLPCGNLIWLARRCCTRDDHWF